MCKFVIETQLKDEIISRVVQGGPLCPSQRNPCCFIIHTLTLAYPVGICDNLIGEFI